MVVRAFNPSTQEIKIGKALWVWGQFGLLDKLQDKKDKSYIDKKAKYKTVSKNQKQTKCPVYPSWLPNFTDTKIL